MNPRRIGILVVAVVIAAVAAIGLLSYVRGVEDVALEEGGVAKVWVVQQPVQKGTSASEALAQGLIAEQEFPSKYRPSNAIVDPSAELTGLVAVFDLPVNEILKEGIFVSPNVVSTGITDRLEERDLVTVSLSVDQVRGASHQIDPGDYVNILINRPVDASESVDAAGNPVPAGSSLYTQLVRYVYQKAEVLAVDQDLTPDIGETEDAEVQQEVRDDGLITLAVPPDAVQTILSVGQENLYLSLVPRNYEPTVIPPLEENPVFPAEDPRRLTPYGPDEQESQE